MLSTQDQEKIVQQLRDREWRLSNLYYIVDEKSQKIPFRPNLIQTRIRKERTDKISVILKYRQ